MIDVIEIPVLVVEKYQSQDFFGDLSFLPLPETGGIVYAKYTVSDDKQIYLYLLEKFMELRDFAACDRLIPKAAFSWLIHERRDAAFENTLQAYTNRYSMPLFCITPQAIDDTLNEGKEPNLQPPVLYYNSRSADPLRDMVRSSFVKLMELAEAENTTFVV